MVKLLVDSDIRSPWLCVMQTVGDHKGLLLNLAGSPLPVSIGLTVSSRLSNAIIFVEYKYH